jgi:hypothetical protein
VRLAEYDHVMLLNVELAQITPARADLDRLLSPGNIEMTDCNSFRLRLLQDFIQRDHVRCTGVTGQHQHMRLSTIEKFHVIDAASSRAEGPVASENWIRA